jgi:hypothetical protein
MRHQAGAGPVHQVASHFRVVWEDHSGLPDGRQLLLSCPCLRPGHRPVLVQAVKCRSVRGVRPGVRQGAVAMRPRWNYLPPLK